MSFTKGYFRVGDVKINFMLNPTTIERRRSWGWGTVAPPGRSHALAVGGAPGGDSLSFTLRFDGISGRTDEERALLGHSVRGHVNRVLSFTFPHSETGNEYGSPQEVYVVAGSVFRGKVVVEDVSISYLAFDTSMEPTKADVSVTCLVMSDQSETDWTFLLSEGSES